MSTSKSTKGEFIIITRANCQERGILY